jgi:hypothetical protein
MFRPRLDSRESDACILRVIGLRDAFRISDEKQANEGGSRFTNQREEGM